MISKEFIRRMQQQFSLSLLLLLFGANTIIAQSPNWAVNANDFQYTMTFVGFLNVEGRTLANTNDKVAAFVNGKCRGVANLIYVDNQKRYYSYLTVFSNIENETVNFKIYDSEKNVVKDIIKTKSFTSNQHFGNLFQAYSFASPALSSAADIIDFNFKNIVRKNIIYDSTKVGIYIEKQADVTALNAIFSLSTGANAFIETNPLISGSNSINFTNPVVIRVRSEDESVLKEWMVSIKQAITYYRKNVVCYAKGEIKVVYPVEGAVVSIELNGQFFVSQPITKGQTIFTNLDAGTYKVKVDGVTKEIIITQ
jgi:hypothetical protein